MRPYGTNKQLQKRRQRALGRLKRGKSVVQVAAQLGVTRWSVYRWCQKETTRQKSERAPGKPAYLSNEHIKQLEQELLRGAYAHEYSEDYWTLDRIGDLIWDLFAIRYTPSGVWRLLDRMNWSCQKVQRLALQRNEAAIKSWKRYTWPRIKKWQALHATLVLIDESGFNLVSPLKRSWGPRGKTPTARTSLDHHQHLNLFGALLVSPKLRKIRLSICSFRCNLCSEHTILFWKQLLRLIPGDIVLVWDRHKIHISSVTDEFLQQHPRIHIFHFPICAPELNPMEFVWTQISEHSAGFAPHNIHELVLLEQEHPGNGSWLA